MTSMKEAKFKADSTIEARKRLHLGMINSFDMNTVEL
jgi:hypothetical protein